MSTESKDIKRLGIEQSNKLDHFLAGVIIAIVVYLIKDSSPERIGLNSWSIQLVGFIAFLVSAFFSFLTLQSNVKLLLHNADFIGRRDSAREATEKINNYGSTPNQAFKNSQTGEIVSCADIEAIRDKSVRGAEELRNKTYEIWGQNEGYRKFRNLLLVVGFVSTASAKIAHPYLEIGCDKKTAEQVDADQPATATESKSEANEEPKTESEVRSQ